MEKKISLPVTIKTIDQFIHFVSSFLKRQKFDELRISEIEIAVEEVLANILHHAYKGTEGTAEVRCLGEGSPVTIVIADSGTPFDLTNHKTSSMASNIKELRVGGLGITLVKRFVDAIQYQWQAGKNVLTLIVHDFKERNPQKTGEKMKVVIWGSRGSLPASLRSENIRYKLKKALELSRNHQLETEGEIDNFIDSLPMSIRGTFGTNTSCVQIDAGGDYMLLDAGTGLRDFGHHVMQSGKMPTTFHLFMSHIHWDHIMGFPFFIPAYIPGNRIEIYGYHDQLESAFINQMDPPCFPVPLKFMGADIHFNRLSLDKPVTIGDVCIHIMKQFHPGDSIGYRFEKDGKSVVYSTDSEHKVDPTQAESPFISFFKDADLLIFDAMYSMSDILYTKEDWGHSSNLVATDLAIESGVKHLCLFHSEPVYHDGKLERILNNTRKYANLYKPDCPMQITMAFDGQEIVL